MSGFIPDDILNEVPPEEHKTNNDLLEILERATKREQELLSDLQLLQTDMVKKFSMIKRKKAELERIQQMLNSINTKR